MFTRGQLQTHPGPKQGVIVHDQIFPQALLSARSSAGYWRLIAQAGWLIYRLFAAFVAARCDGYRPGVCLDSTRIQEENVRQDDPVEVIVRRELSPSSSMGRGECLKWSSEFYCA